jgi:hypothetical protein
MSNHGKPELGPTGNFPRGKMSDDDDGEIRIGIAADKGKGVVIIDFGIPVVWVGFPREQAIELADKIRDKAAELPE